MGRDREARECLLLVCVAEARVKSKERGVRVEELILATSQLVLLCSASGATQERRRRRPNFCLKDQTHAGRLSIRIRAKIFIPYTGS